jgi:hypothetical protein
MSMLIKTFQARPDIRDFDYSALTHLKGISFRVDSVKKNFNLPKFHISEVPRC